MGHKFIHNTNSITVIVNGQTHTLSHDSPVFQTVLNAIKAEAWDTVAENLSPGDKVRKWLGEGWTFVDHFLEYKGRRVDSSLNGRLLKMVEEGHSPAPWLRFWERLQNNPSYRSIEQLYTFLQNQNIPIDEDGYIRAYKSVTSDYKDWHSQSIDNTPGAEPHMPRNQVSDDPDVPCHEGFHVGAMEYVNAFGGAGKRIIICQVDPADVVSVPKDHHCQKVRVCRYKVLGNYSGQLMPDTVFTDDPVTEEAPDVQWESLSEEGLMGLRIDQLRGYATHSLKIVGASKIPGGKVALVKRILEVRGS